MSQIRLILITICLLSSILNNRTNAEEIHEQIIAERIAKALKIGIEDDIWFNGEHSSYYFLNAQELQYEYTYDGYKDHATVLFAEENQDNTINFYMLDLPANNGIFTNEIYESIFYNDPLDYEELKKNIYLV